MTSGGKNPSSSQFLLAGGFAGFAVDATLFPLDTIKTRLQSSQGFAKAGGFRGIYSGLGTAVLGSAPAAAFFFLTYENTKKFIKKMQPNAWHPIVHMTGAAAGEVMACIIRVPIEVVKQRQQAGVHKSSLNIIRQILSTEGPIGMYRGYITTVFREIPFAFIQFPLWEMLKKKWSDKNGLPLSPWQSAVCGAVSGGIAAAATTPLDVAKTRIMLASPTSPEAKGNVISVLRTVHSTRGISGLFAGLTPRVLWISVGGAVFLGVYDAVLTFLA